MTTLPAILPLAPPAFRLSLFDRAGRPITPSRVAGDGTLAGAIATGSNPDMEALLSNPVASPASFRLQVYRDTIGFPSLDCSMRALLYDAGTRALIKAVDVNGGLRGAGFTGLVTYDCKGDVVFSYPSGVAVSRMVYLVFKTGRGTEIGRSAAFRLSDLAGAGTADSRVADNRTLTERTVDATAGAARWTGDTFNKLLWAGGLAGGVVLLMLARK